MTAVGCSKRAGGMQVAPGSVRLRYAQKAKRCDSVPSKTGLASSEPLAKFAAYIAIVMILLSRTLAGPLLSSCRSKGDWMKRREFLALAAGAAARPGAASAQTDDYPTRTVRFVIGFGAGGGTDTARIVAQKLARPDGARRHADADRQEARSRVPADRRVQRFQGATEEPLGHAYRRHRRRACRTAQVGGGAMVQRGQSSNIQFAQ